MRKTFKRVLALILVLISITTTITPALAVDVNVDGIGGSNASLGSVSGQNFYNNADSMWKVTIFYCRYDWVNVKTDNYHLGNSSVYKKYGDSIYVYHPTAKRGASGKINLNFFKNGLFVRGNKPEFLYQSGGKISGVKNLELKTYTDNWFVADTSSPAIAMNGYTNDAVKEYFGEASTLQKMIKEITKWKKGSWSNANFYSLLDAGNTAFSIDGFNSVDKTTNGGKAATTGYKWSSSKYLNGSDWVYGVKTDYNGKQIYIYPQISGSNTFNAVSWVMVYEPVLCIGPNKTAQVNGKTYNNICCTPTEYAILQHYGIIDVGPWLDDTVFDYLSNSTYLDKKWGGIAPRSSKFTASTSMDTIFKQAGIGMSSAPSYNYVIKDYEMKISVPKTANTGEAFNVKYYATNKSKDNKGNSGNVNNPLTVNFVWVARVYNGTNEYWFDLWNLRNKTLTTSNALKNGSTLVTTYSEAAKIVEARRSGEDGKPKSKIPAKTQNKWEDYTYTLDSAFSGYTFEVRACVNTDTDGNNAFAKKELNSGAYYKSGETDSWGNNYVKKSVKITSVPEVEPVIGVQLNNTTNNSEIDLEGKKFAVWCIDSFSYQVLEISGKINKLPYS